MIPSLASWPASSSGVLTDSGESVPKYGDLVTLGSLDAATARRLAEMGGRPRR
jgi:hypothetical protein